MATNITSTALDFASIKTSLKNYLKAKTEFADYDFEGSGLSNILDVLAYNTHFNGLIANLATNESFLHTAQLRSSLVSHAESLGFDIRSKTSSQVKFTASMNLAGVSGRAHTYTMPIDTVFTGTNEEGSHTFRTLAAYTATDDGTGSYTFKDADGTAAVVAYEGTNVTKTFFVGEASDRQVYIIPDDAIDTTSAVVKVYSSPTSTDNDEYTVLSKAIKVDSNSRYYTLRETPNGSYELNFGDGVTFGKAPESGSKIVVTYLRTNGGLANGCKAFTTQKAYSIGGTAYAVSIVPQTNSAGGGDKQGIESIRQNAPSAFAAQQRLVTPEDYRATIAANFPTVSDISVWGGQDNIPIAYGKVYIALDFNEGLAASAKQVVKDSIKTNFSDNLSVMSISPVFVDPTETYFELSTDITINPDLTSRASQTMENITNEKILSYFSDTINGFGKTFRRSNLLSDIDELDDGILNSKMEVKVQMRLIPVLNTDTAYEIIFPVPLAAPDDQNITIESTSFDVAGVSGKCVVRNKLSTNTLQIVNIDDSSSLVTDNIGTYDAAKGTIELTNFNPTLITGGVDYIKFSCPPQNQGTVKALRAFVFKHDADKSRVTSTVDRQGVRVAL